MLAGFGAIVGSRRPTPGEAAIPGRLLGPGIGLLCMSPSEGAFLLPFVDRVNIADSAVGGFGLSLISREVPGL